MRSGHRLVCLVFLLDVYWLSNCPVQCRCCRCGRNSLHVFPVYWMDSCLMPHEVLFAGAYGHGACSGMLCSAFV